MTEAVAQEVAVEKPTVKPKRVRKPAAKKQVPVDETSADAPADAVAPEAAASEPVLEAVATPVAQVDHAPVTAEPEPEIPAAPKKRGWWSRG